MHDLARDHRVVVDEAVRLLRVAVRLDGKVNEDVDRDEISVSIGSRLVGLEVAKRQHHRAHYPTPVHRRAGLDADKRG